MSRYELGDEFQVGCEGDSALHKYPILYVLTRGKKGQFKEPCHEIDFQDCTSGWPPSTLVFALSLNFDRYIRGVNGHFMSRCTFDTTLNIWEGT